MARETKYVVQPYVRKEKGGLAPAPPLMMNSAEAARGRAQRLFESGRYAGVDAYVSSGDPELGEYGEPKFLVRLGEVWELD